MSGVDYGKLNQLRQQSEGIKQRYKVASLGVKSLIPMNGKTPAAHEGFLVAVSCLQQLRGELGTVEQMFATFAPVNFTMGPPPTDPLWWFAPMARPMIEMLIEQTGVTAEAITTATLINIARILQTCEQLLTSAEDNLTKAGL